MSQSDFLQIPFWERPENKVKWKVADALESFFHWVEIYDEDYLKKSFSGYMALDNAYTFCDANSIKNPVMIQYIKMFGIHWVEFDSRDKAESYARKKRFKMPVYQSF